MLERMRVTSLTGRLPRSDAEVIFAIGAGKRKRKRKFGPDDRNAATVSQHVPRQCAGSQSRSGLGGQTALLIQMTRATMRRMPTMVQIMPLFITRSDRAGAR